MAVRQAAARGVVAPRSRSREGLLDRIRRDRWMLLFMIPGFIYFVVFQYVPLLGYVIAFKDYSPFLGFRASPWSGLENFRDLFASPDVGNALVNTIQISLLQILLYFPAPIALALLLNSVANGFVRRIMQSIVYLPHFIGWVIIVSLWQQVLGGDGLVNQVLRNQGLDTVNIMANPGFFKPLLVLQVIWKDIGWGTIIFLAALTKIDPTLYEAAVIDGAGPRRRLRDVTLPGIRSIVFLLLILRLGNTLTVGFEQILLQRENVGLEASEVLDTFVYAQGIVGGDWGMSAAVGLLKGIVGTILVVGANRVAKRFGEEGLF